MTIALGALWESTGLELLSVTEAMANIWYKLKVFNTWSLLDARDPATASKALQVNTMETCSSFESRTNCKSAKVGPMRPSLRPCMKREKGNQFLPWVFVADRSMQLNVNWSILFFFITKNSSKSFTKLAHRTEASCKQCACFHQSPWWNSSPDPGGQMRLFSSGFHPSDFHLWSIHFALFPHKNCSTCSVQCVSTLSCPCGSFSQLQYITCCDTGSLVNVKTHFVQNLSFCWTNTTDNWWCLSSNPLIIW